MASNIRQFRKVKAKTLPPIHPNAGIEAEYQRKLNAFMDEMHKSYTYWITAQYRANTPHMAMDGRWDDDMSPAKALQKLLNRLWGRWESKIDDLSVNMAKWFAQSAMNRVDATLKSHLKKAGFTVEWKMTKDMNDVMQANIASQVGLIRTIPKKYHNDVEEAVMRSVQVGRDLKTLSAELAEKYNLTKRRAAFIARDQNNKATAVLQKTRQTQVGITEAVWLHSGGGLHPRPSHVAFSGHRYKVSDGVKLDDDPGIIWPGTAINCRCVCKAVIPALDG